jgi:Fe(3+) dicitrate transport protein
MGIEAFGELNILPIFKPETSNQLNIFINAAWIHARYLRSEQPGINGNQVEMVPPWVIRTGLTWKHKNFRTSLQYSFTETHFSDASNATRTSTAVEGIIPAYQVVDFSLSYSFKSFTFEGSLNNVLNEMYFTRRAESYPGPGLIPADGRNFTITLQYRFVRPRK